MGGFSFEIFSLQNEVLFLNEVGIKKSEVIKLIWFQILIEVVTLIEKVKYLMFEAMINS